MNKWTELVEKQSHIPPNRTAEDREKILKAALEKIAKEIGARRYSKLRSMATTANKALEAAYGGCNHEG